MPFATDQERALANLLASVMNAREQEGARVSRILHDDVGQVMSAIGLQLDLLRMDLAEDPAAAGRRIADIQRVLEKAIGHVRDLSYELSPSVVERTGLECALERLVARFRRNRRGPVRMCYDPQARFPLDTATALYKIAEQALDNAVRHARASEIEVAVRIGRSGNSLEIRDDGIGFRADGSEVQAAGLGLHMMKYYAAQSGLKLAVWSEPRQGTIIRAVYRPVGEG